MCHRHDKIAIVSVGNSLVGDDGAGPAVLAELARRALPKSIALIAGGVDSLNALYRLETYDVAIFIDGVRGLDSPGEIICFDGNALLANARSVVSEEHVSLHELGFSEALVFAEMVKMTLPHHLMFYGIQVDDETINAGAGGVMSAAVGDAVLKVADMVEAEVRELCEEHSHPLHC